MQFHLISCWTFGIRNAIVTVNTTTTTTIVIVTNILMPSSSRVGSVNKPPTLHEAVVTITLKRSGRTVGCLYLDLERFVVYNLQFMTLLLQMRKVEGSPPILARDWTLPKAKQ